MWSGVRIAVAIKSNTTKAVQNKLNKFVGRRGFKSYYLSYEY